MEMFSSFFFFIVLGACSTIAAELGVIHADNEGCCLVAFGSVVLEG
jgi:hypothetical protein